MGISSRTSDRRLCPIAISRHSKNLRGIGFEVEEMMKLFLVIIIGLGIVILIIAASGGISSLLTEFCAKNPAICGGSPTIINDKTAKASFNAFSIAYKCVADPDSCRCIKTPCICKPGDDSCSTSSLSASGLSNGISGFQVTPGTVKSNDVKVECTKEVTKDVQLPFFSAADRAECERKCKSDPLCKGWDYEFLVTGDEINPAEKKCLLTYDKDSLDCKVTNFNLPESYGITGKFQEYIEGFGDPSYVVYFEKFPEGHDYLWKGWSPWYTSFGNLMEVAMCVSDIAGMRKIKTIGAATIGQTLSSAEETSNIYAVANEVKGSLTFRFRGATERDIKPFIEKLKTLLPKAKIETFALGKKGAGRGLRITFKEEIQQNLPEIMASSEAGVITKAYDKFKGYLNNPALASAKTAEYAAIDGSAAYLLARMDSEVGKFIPEPQSLSMQSPLRSPNVESVNTLKVQTDIKDIPFIGMPAVNHRIGVATDVYTPLSIASPCHADITVGKMDSINCKLYQYSSGSETTCLEMSKASDGDSTCDFKNVKGMSKTTHEKIKEMLNSNDKVLFEYNSNSIQKINIPLFGSKYLANIETSLCESYPNLLQCYQASFYDGTSLSSDKIQIACGKPGVITTGAFFGSAGEFNSVYFKSLTEDEKQNTELCFIDLTLARDINKRIEPLIDTTNIFFVKYKGRFVAEIVKYPSYMPMISILDSDSDGKWNSVTIKSGVGDNVPIFNFDDKNSDGTLDSIQANNCKIPAISVTMDAKNYNEKENFCYEKSRAESYSGVAVTTIGFVSNAFIKKASLVGWLVGTGIDCAIAVIEISWQSAWPSGGIK